MFKVPPVVPSVQPVPQTVAEGMHVGGAPARTVERTVEQSESPKEPEPSSAFTPSGPKITSGLLRTHVAFSVDHETGDMVIRVIDNETDEVIRQVPPEEFVRIATRLAKMVGLLFDQKS